VAGIGDVSRIIPPLYTRSHTDFIYDTDLIDVNGPISGFRYIFDRPLRDLIAPLSYVNVMGTTVLGNTIPEPRL
jgi:hypothetical protein